MKDLPEMDPRIRAAMGAAPAESGLEVDEHIKRLCRLLEWQSLLHADTDPDEARAQSHVTAEDIRYMKLLQELDGGSAGER